MGETGSNLALSLGSSVVENVGNRVLEPAVRNAVELGVGLGGRVVDGVAHAVGGKSTSGPQSSEGVAPSAQSDHESSQHGDSVDGGAKEDDSNRCADEVTGDR